MTDPRGVPAPTGSPTEPTEPTPTVRSAEPTGSSDDDARGGFLDPVLAFARAAEGFARRTVGAFRLLAVLGLAAVAGLAFWGRNLLGLPAWANLPLTLGMSVPPLALLALQQILHRAVGLPDRVLGILGRVNENAKDVQGALGERARRPAGGARWTFRDLVRAGRVVRSLRRAGDEAVEALVVARGAVALWNPLFPVLLLAASVLTGLVCATAGVVLLLQFL